MSLLLRSRLLAPSSLRLTLSSMRARSDKSDFTERQSEHFTFDHGAQVDATEQEERDSFEKFVDTYGEHRFDHSAPDYVDRDFLASRDEWRYVERLMPQTLVPKPKVEGVRPSAFVMPTTKPGDLPYHVYRTANHMLPVYCDYNVRHRTMTTLVRRVDGNLFLLRDQLAEMLQQKYRMEFLSRVAEVYGQVAFRGDFEEDFKNFLIQKGF